MSDTFSAFCGTREQAHEAAQRAYQHAQAVLLNGKPAVISVKEHENDRSLAQNAFYWGVFLRDISAQARIGGERYTVDAWHELGKRQFLGFEVKKVVVAGRRKQTVIRRLRSTTDLSVRQFAKYLEEFGAFAVTDLGVAFSESAP